MGSQLVALNYQTPSPPLQLNHGKFEENGGCGYLLKPRFLRTNGRLGSGRGRGGAGGGKAGNGATDQSRGAFSITRGPFPNRMKLVVTVLSGNQLPVPTLSGASNETLDLYVTCDLTGIPADVRRCRTAVVRDNRLNPIWNETFTFHVTCPELALLHLTVRFDWICWPREPARKL